MAFDAGSVFIRLGALFQSGDFDKWDRAVDAERAKARTPIEQKLELDTSGYERAVAAMEAERQLLERRITATGRVLWRDPVANRFVSPPPAEAQRAAGIVGSIAGVRGKENAGSPDNPLTFVMEAGRLTPLGARAAQMGYAQQTSGPGGGTASNISTGQGDNGPDLTGMTQQMADALDAIRQDNRATQNLLQQQLGVSKDEASRLMSDLERRGIVGPYRGAQAPRQLNLPSEQAIQQALAPEDLQIGVDQSYLDRALAFAKSKVSAFVASASGDTITEDVNVDTAAAEAQLAALNRPRITRDPVTGRFAPVLGNVGRGSGGRFIPVVDPFGGGGGGGMGPPILPPTGGDGGDGGGGGSAWFWNMMQGGRNSGVGHWLFGAGNRPAGFGGGLGLGILGGLFGAGIHGPLGAVGGALGLGPEHIIGAGAAILGSGLTAAAGGGALLAGAAGQTLVGGGADTLVMKSTIADTKTLYQGYQNLNMAVLQYGRGSTQAANAQRALNAQIQDLGGPNAVGVKAEMQLAKNYSALQDFWKRATQNARVSAANILEQVVGLGRSYIPRVANAARENLNIINTGLHPLFRWLEGPTGVGIFNNLENNFRRHLPTAVDAFVTTIKALLRTVSQASDFTGNFTKKWDELAHRWQNMSDTQLHDRIAHLVDVFRVWEDMVKNLAIDLYHLFKSGSGEGTNLVARFDDLLKRWGDWEKSVQGATFLHTFFANREQELIAILQVVGAIAKMFGEVYVALQPLVPAITMFARVTAGALGGLAVAIKPFADLLAAILTGFTQLGTTLPGFKDLVILPLGIFLTTWKMFSLTAARNLFDLTGNMQKLRAVADGARGVVKALFADGPSAAWASLKGLFSGKQADSPQMTMLGAMKEGATIWADTVKAAFAEGAAQIKEAMGVGGEKAATDIEAAEVSGGEKAGAEIATAEAKGGAVAAEEEAVGTAGGGAAGAAGGAAGGAATGAEAGAAGGLLAGARNLAGTAGLVALGYTAFKGVEQIVKDISGGQAWNRYGGGLANQLTVGGWGSHVGSGPSGTHISMNAGDLLSSFNPFGGHFGQLKYVSDSVNQINQLRKELAGVTSPAQLTNKRIEEIDAQLRKLAADKGLNPTVRTGVENLLKTFDSAKQRIDDWNAGFNRAWKAVHDFAVRGGDSIKNLKDRFDTNMRAIKSTVGLNSEAGKKLAETNFDQLVSHVDEAMRKGKLSVQNGVEFMRQVADHGTKGMRDDLNNHYQDILQIIQTSWQNGNLSTTNALQMMREIYKTENSKIRDDQINWYDQQLQDLHKSWQQGNLTTQQYAAKREQIHRQMAQSIQGTEMNLTGNSLAILNGMNTATASGMNSLFKELNSALGTLGVKPVHWTTRSGEVMNSSKNWQHGFRLASYHAAGGIIPGREFGYGDEMTLVDPMGRPVARMAGDEAVFNRHQMPYVEAGLQAIGFRGASELWQKVNRPHGYASGGLISAGGGAMPYGAIEGVWERAGGPKNVAALMAAIAEAESSGIPTNIQQGQPYATTGWGLWQITPGNSVPQFGVNQALLNPLNNARAALAKYRSQGLGAWTTYTSGAYRQFLHGNIPANLSGAYGAAIPTLGAPHLAGEPGPLESLGQGALNRATRAANDYLNSHAPTGGMGYGPHGYSGAAPLKQGLPSAVIQMIREADMIASHDYPYVWGGGHGQLGVPSVGIPGPGYTGHTLGFDCSGTVSAVLGAAHLVSGPMTSGDYMNWGAPGPGKYVTIYASPSHVFMSLEDHYFGTSGGNPGGGANWIPSFPEAMPAVRHPRGLQSGGYLGSFLAGNESARMDPTNYPFFKQLPPGERDKLKRNRNHVLPGLAGGGYIPGFAPGGRIRHRRAPVGIRHAGTGSTTRRRRQPVQRAARHLPSLAKLISIVPGIRQFSADDASITNLENQYSRQESILSLYDPNGLTPSDLDILMGIREKEWGILYHEWDQLPGVYSAIQGQLRGTRTRIGHHMVSEGIDPEVSHLTSMLAHDESAINNLEDQRIRNSMHGAAARHAASAAARAAAAGHLRRISPMYDKILQNLNAAVNISTQLANLPSPVNLNPLAGAKYAAGQNQNRQLIRTRQRLIAERSLIMEHNAIIRAQITQAGNAERALAQRYANQGWAAAYAEQMKNYQIELKIRKLREAVTKLKALLKKETALQKAYQTAASDIHTRLYGASASNPSGESVQQQLGDIGFDILSLQQQGGAVAPAHIPPPNGRLDSADTIISNIKNILKQLGIILPPGTGTSGYVSAQDALNDFLAFQADRANMFAQFGSNFVPAGMAPFATPTAQAAGMQYYGAAAGAESGVPGAAGGGYLPNHARHGDTNFNITHHYHGGPDNPHSYSAGLRHELGALV